ncbi:MAG TPA: hypothetical protein VGH46_07485 [Gaiellaceae bacterium]
MKKYFLSVAAAFAVALVAAGGALATNPPSSGSPPGLIPNFAPQSDAWLNALSVLPTSPAPPALPPAPKPAPQSAPATQPQQIQPVQGTVSIYEQSAQPWILAAQGCAAAKRLESGIVVLDFGKPAYERGGYGTLLFSGRFAKNHKITAALFAYANGYSSCLPSGSTASIEIARGTSNYDPTVPSAYSAGVRWARETNKLGLIVAQKGLTEHITVAAADDAEPAWDRQFHETRAFFHGFSAAVHGHTLYDYGSLDGGVGAIWSARQALYVAGGLRYTAALPEIYNSAMAREWAELARIARARFRRDVRFAGVMTERTASCACGVGPSVAHDVLAQALDSAGVGDVTLPPGGTNIEG